MQKDYATKEGVKFLIQSGVKINNNSDIFFLNFINEKPNEILRVLIAAGCELRHSKKSEIEYLDLVNNFVLAMK